MPCNPAHVLCGHGMLKSPLMLNMLCCYGTEGSLSCPAPVPWRFCLFFEGPTHGIDRVVGAGVTSYGSQICMTNSLRHVKAAPALAMSCALPASRWCCKVSFGSVVRRFWQ